jgi:flagellar hook protein FlgE
MSILSSLYTGVSGLNANGQWLSVIGDNIANVNTIGFKGSTMSFGDILSQTFTGSGSTSQIGRGVNVGAVTTIFSQGTFQNTSSGLDLAIDGDGFFIVNSQGVNAYTRAGSFQIDRDGYVVNAHGDILQGITYDAVGNPVGMGDININTGTYMANPTTTATLVANLDADDTAINTVLHPWAVPPPAGSYNESTAITVYDGLGGAHQVSVYFVKGATTPTGVTTWTAHYVYDSGGTPTEATPPITQTYDATGQMLTGQTGSVTFDFGGGLGTTVAVNMTGSTQYAADFAVSSMTQNGYTAGDLKNISIGTDGIISGTFTNGQTRTLGQVQLARFPAPTELMKLGNNLFSRTAASGDPLVGNPESSGLGRTLSSSLELSTVDLAEQFTSLITAQRGFQANTKIITTTDDLLNLLISIKQ